jgi:hypothetical protein
VEAISKNHFKATPYVQHSAKMMSTDASTMRRPLWGLVCLRLPGLEAAGEVGSSKNGPIATIHRNEEIPMSAYTVHTLVTGQEIRFADQEGLFIGYHPEDICRLVGVSDYKSVRPFLHPADVFETASEPLNLSGDVPEFFIAPEGIADLINKLHTPEAVKLREEIGDVNFLVYPFRLQDEESEMPSWWWHPVEYDHPALEVYRSEQDEIAVIKRAFNLLERMNARQQAHIEYLRKRQER